MAIDTLRKRSAVARFGMPWHSGTRPPSSPLDAFERAALLGLYLVGGDVPPVDTPVPDCGWTFSSETTVFEFQYQQPVFRFNSESSVFEFGEC